MRKVDYSKQFKRDIKKHTEALLTHQWLDVFHALVHDLPIHEKYKDHALTGNFLGYRDVHVKNDLVLIYKVEDDVLELHRIGTHAQVFG